MVLNDRLVWTCGYIQLLVIPSVDVPNRHWVAWRYLTVRQNPTSQLLHWIPASHRMVSVRGNTWRLETVCLSRRQDRIILVDALLILGSRAVVASRTFLGSIALDICAWVNRAIINYLSDLSRHEVYSQFRGGLSHMDSYARTSKNSIFDCRLNGTICTVRHLRSSNCP